MVYENKWKDLDNQLPLSLLVPGCPRAWWLNRYLILPLVPTPHALFQLGLIRCIFSLGGRGTIRLQVCLRPRCPFLHGLPWQPASVPESRVWVPPQRGGHPTTDPLWGQPCLPPGRGPLRQPPLCRRLCLLSFWAAERPNPRASSSHSGKWEQWFCLCFWLFLELALWVLSVSGDRESNLSPDWHP